MNELWKSAKAQGRLATIAATALLGLAAVSPAAAQDYPSESLDMTVAFAPGGGNDVMSRGIAEILQKYDLYPENIEINNRVGGSGAVGWGYLYTQTGSAYDISTTSGSLFTTPLQADTPWTVDDFTPIALLAADDLALTVLGSSRWNTVEEFIAEAKEKPPVIAGTGTVNVDFIVIALFAEKAGFEFEYVPFNSYPDSQTALLSGAVDALLGNPGEIIGMVDSKDMRALAYSGPVVPPEMEGVPTMADLEFDPGISMPRGLIMAPDAPQEAVDWWIKTMQFIVTTPEWKEYISTNLLTEYTLFGDDFATFLEKKNVSFAETLRSRGFIK